MKSIFLTSFKGTKSTPDKMCETGRKRSALVTANIVEMFLTSIVS